MLGIAAEVVAILVGVATLLDTLDTLKNPELGPSRMWLSQFFNFPFSTVANSEMHAHNSSRLNAESGFSAALNRFSKNCNTFVAYPCENDVFVNDKST